MTHHNLKCFVDHFQPIADKANKSQVRKNDRNFKINDTVTFHEGYSENGDYIFTGRKISAVISHIDNYALQDGYVNLSLDKVGTLIIKGYE